MKKDELKELIASGQTPRLIDVREPDEYKYGDKIDGAENIPMGQVFLEEEKGAFSKKEKIVTVCKSGARAGMVARELREMGYDADVLDGGMDEWRA